MRAVSLSEDPAFGMLKSKFVCGWRDIGDEDYCGRSGSYEPDQGAVHTTNGAGPHNIQMFILTADGVVLTCLPGFWEPNDLKLELEFAEKLNKAWKDPTLYREKKDALFRQMHLDHLKVHPQDMVDRSAMQGFDKKFEEKRAATTDCLLTKDGIQPALRPRKDDEFKTTDQIMHERMAARPFVAYEKFDVAKYTDYGRPKYDKKRVEGEPVVTK